MTSSVSSSSSPGSRRRSASLRSPDPGSRYLPPPPSGPALSRSSSRHRTPAGAQTQTDQERATRPHSSYHDLISRPPLQHGTSPGPDTYTHNLNPYIPGNAVIPGPFGVVGGIDRPEHGSSPLYPGHLASHDPVNLSASAQRKRLIVACDGTWKSADSANLTGDAIIPSNVVHITRAIKSTSRDGISQVVFYQSGIGTDGGPVTRLVGGATAKGLEDDILEGYYWLCQNWTPGDEIFLVGFSRGAFTARSVAGMIDAVGLLTREGIKHVNVVFKDFENRSNPTYKSDQPDRPFRRKPSAASPKYARLLQEKGLSRLGVKIKAISVFDTVGSLGIPRVPLFERFGLQSRAVKEYEFFDTALGNNVEYAFHALALDEQRAAFSPSVWEKMEGNQTDLRQVWFPGVHSNVGGGGYLDTNLSNISLAWMMAQLTPLLDMDGRYILEMAENNMQYYRHMGEKPRPWSLGRLYNSLTGIWVLGGRRPRKPGMYNRVNSEGVETDSPLRETHEYVHASARSRFTLDGPGYRDTGLYQPRGLDAYRLRLTGADAGRGRSVAVWESRRRGKKGPKKVLPEAPLFEVERQLLGLSPQVEHLVLRPSQVEIDNPAKYRIQRNPHG